MKKLTLKENKTSESWEKTKKKEIIMNLCALFDVRESVLDAFESEIFLMKNEVTGVSRLFTPKQMLERLSIALAQVKADNISENLLNKVRQIIYFLYLPTEITKKYIKV